MKNRQKELIQQMSDKEILFHLYITQFFLLTISSFFVIILFKDISTFFNLFQWNDWRILTFGVTSAVIVVLLDLFFMKYLPKHMYDDGGINERIFKQRSVWHIAVITALIAFSEEILFRGIIQTKFGIITASVIFAIVHYRYLFHWFLFLNIVLLSFFIGSLYLWTGNLAVPVVMHFLVDFLLGLAYRRKGGGKHEGTNSFIQRSSGNIEEEDE